MDHFDYDGDGVLRAEGVPLPRIAAEVGTPVYVYASATLARHYRVFAEAFAGLDALVAFSVKACPNVAVLRLLGRLGAGADIVSGGELARALRAGIPAGRIVFSGVGKTAPEMEAALDAGVLQFNVESEGELEALAGIARARGVRAPIAFRVNPDIRAGSHSKVATGHREAKFGVAIARARGLYARAADLEGIEVTGIDVHIGSQIVAPAPFREAFAAVAALADGLRGDGHDIRIVDAGGGVGIPQGGEPGLAPEEYAAVVRETLGGLGCRIVLEPGRLIAGNAGVLLASVLYLKEEPGRRFAILDAAMNDFLRPALYGARHPVAPVARPPEDSPRRPWTLAGPVCESGDVFTEDEELGPIAPGDLLAFRGAGAYGASMASTYNSRPLVPEVLVDGDSFAVVRRRQDPAEALALEPDPLEDGAP